MWLESWWEKWGSKIAQSRALTYTRSKYLPYLTFRRCSVHRSSFSGLIPSLPRAKTTACMLDAAEDSSFRPAAGAEPIWMSTTKNESISILVLSTNVDQCLFASRLNYTWGGTISGALRSFIGAIRKDSPPFFRKPWASPPTNEPFSHETYSKTPRLSNCGKSWNCHIQK
jgi:hypothetical protein